MNSIRRFVVLSVFFCLSKAHASGYPVEPTSADLKSCESHFQYKGKFINPILLNSFNGFESDSGVPAVVSVDVAAAEHTNQYSDAGVKYNADGAEFTEKTKGDPPDSYGYRWIGRLANGAEIVESWQGGGGGTMVARTLFVLRCSLGKGRRPAGDKDGEPKRLLESEKNVDAPYSRLLLTVERYYIIGDRVAATYAIKGNVVTVEFPNQEKPVTRTIRVD